MLDTMRSFHSIVVRAESSDFERGVVRQTISTGNVARDGAIIEPTGWDLRNYNRNPVVLYAHDDSSGGWVGVQPGTRATMPIARATDVGLDGDQLVATSQFDMEDEFAVRVLGKIQRGFINATSVRWKPLTAPKREVREVLDEDGVTREREVWVFPRNELLEFSYVPIPADPGAVIARADGKAIEWPLSDNEPPARSLVATAVPGLLAYLRDLPRIDEVDREDALGLYRELERVLAVAAVTPSAPAPEALTPEQMATLERQLVSVAARIEGLTQQSGDTAARALARVTGRPASEFATS